MTFCLPQFRIAGRLGGLGRNLLGQGVGGRRHVALRRVVPQQPAHRLDAPQQLALRLQEAGHFALAGETALDRGAEDEVAPLVLADLVVGRRDLHDLGEGDLLVGPLLLDDLEVMHDLSRRPDLQVDVQEHLDGFLVDLRPHVPFLDQFGQMGHRRQCIRHTPCAVNRHTTRKRVPRAGYIEPLAQLEKLLRRKAVGVGRLRALRQHGQRLRRSRHKLFGPVGVADDRGTNVILARHVAVKLVVDRRQSHSGSVADVEGNLARPDLEMFERPTDRFLDDRRAAGDRFGDNQVFQPFGGRVEGIQPPDIDVDHSAAADGKLIERIAERLISALQQAEAARDLAAVEFQRGRLVVAMDLAKCWSCS